MSNSVKDYAVEVGSGLAIGVISAFATIGMFAYKNALTEKKENSKNTEKGGDSE